MLWQSCINFNFLYVKVKSRDALAGGFKNLVLRALARKKVLNLWFTQNLNKLNELGILPETIFRSHFYSTVMLLALVLCSTKSKYVAIDYARKTAFFSSVLHGDYQVSCSFIALIDLVYLMCISVTIWLCCNHNFSSSSYLNVKAYIVLHNLV